ncbi:unnamed protein product [Musa acuminata subsp. burmannicoides]
MILVRLFSSVATDPVRTASFGFNPNRGGSGDGAGPIRCRANDRAGGARGSRGSANGGCDPSPLSLSSEREINGKEDYTLIDPIERLLALVLSICVAATETLPSLPWKPSRRPRSPTDRAGRRQSSPRPPAFSSPPLLPPAPVPTAGSPSPSTSATRAPTPSSGPSRTTSAPATPSSSSMSAHRRPYCDDWGAIDLSVSASAFDDPR